MGSIDLVAGTRPEMIKLAPIVIELLRLTAQNASDIAADSAHTAAAVRVLWTDQHRSENMTVDDVLAVFDLTHVQDTGKLIVVYAPSESAPSGRGERLARTVSWLSTVIDPHGIVVVQGDTDSVIAGALAANLMGVSVAHVEAGLRSWDSAMPEELNRIIADETAQLCFAPTELALANLVRHPRGGCTVTGQTSADAWDLVLGQGDAAAARLLADLGIAGQFVFATIHRPENVDDSEQLDRVMMLLSQVAEQVRVVLAVHPRLRVRLGDQSLADGITTVAPVPYGVNVSLLRMCHMAITDSGGLQEELTYAPRSGVVLRRSNERLEAEAAGFIHRFDLRDGTDTAFATILKLLTIEAGCGLDGSPLGASPYRTSGVLSASHTIANALLDRVRQV